MEYPISADRAVVDGEDRPVIDTSAGLCTSPSNGNVRNADGAADGRNHDTPTLYDRRAGTGADQVQTTGDGNMFGVGRGGDPDGIARR